jgi:hypothetical protein
MSAVHEMEAGREGQGERERQGEGEGGERLEHDVNGRGSGRLQYDQAELPNMTLAYRRVRGGSPALQ